MSRESWKTQDVCWTVRLSVLLLCIRLYVKGVLYLLTIAMGRTCYYPPSASMQNELNSIGKAIMDEKMSSGTVPMTLPEMRARLASHMDLSPTSCLATGRDYWRHELMLIPDDQHADRLKLLSLGPDGVLQTSKNGDDISISFHVR